MTPVFATRDDRPAYAVLLAITDGLLVSPGSDSSAEATPDQSSALEAA